MKDDNSSAALRTSSGACRPSSGRSRMESARQGAAQSVWPRISRHNETEMTALSDRAFDALSQVLGDNRYLMGNDPAAPMRRRLRLSRACRPSSNRPRTPRRAHCRTQRVPRPDDGGVLSRVREMTRKWGQAPFPRKRCLTPLLEECERHRLHQCHRLALRREFARFRIHTEHGHVAAFLVAHDEPLVSRIEGEVARYLAA